MNHITHIINLCHKQIPNHFENYGIVYLNISFIDNDKERDKEREVVLDSADNTVSKVIDFIEEAREQGESILIHGTRSYTISLVFYCAYLMLKYKWGLYKTIEFLESRMNKLSLSSALIRQLRSYESRIMERLPQPLSTDWNIYPGMPLE